MIIQEPIKATICFALENYAYSDAIFLSERLYAEVNTEENLYLLATAYFRSGKQNVAYSILSKNKYNPIKSPNCHFLLAKCCFFLGKTQEAINLLTSPILNKNGNKMHSIEDLKMIYGDLSSFVAQILGQLFYKLENFKLSAYYFTLSLKINPFLWYSYTKLLQIDPSKVDLEKLFNIDNVEFKYSCGTNPLINLFNSSEMSDITTKEIPTKILKGDDDSSHYFATPELPKNNTNNLKKIELSTPYAILKQSGMDKIEVITPETDGNWKKMTCLAPIKNINRTTRKFTANQTSAQVLTETSNIGVNRNLIVQMDTSSHSFGVLSLDQSSVNVPHNGHKEMDNNLEVSPKVVPRRINIDSRDNEMMISETINQTTTNTVLTRRSSRLNSDTRSIKENQKTTNSNEKKMDRRVVTPVKRRHMSFNNINKNKKFAKEKDDNITSGISLDFHTGVQAQRSSANGLMELIKKLAIAYKLLSQYKCKEAIEYFKKLPENHFNTGFVISMIARSYFEMGLYEESINYFKKCRSLEIYRLKDLELYSTALWHLQRELELSCLSQELIQFDKLAPETWCVAGNCFSLQKDHETSIKFLKRAIQVDSEFSYAYTLLGHELISADELENARQCFITATRIDPRHYNAWCGIGLIHYKQEKYENAYYYYKRAWEISQQNPIIMSHLAIVMHDLKQTSEAINMLNNASNIDPSNVLVKYHRASIHFSLEEYDKALKELEELRKLVPKESRVYFLIGKIHKIRGDTHLAQMNFSWSINIDPKGSANKHKEFTQQNQASNDEVVVHPIQETSAELSTTPITPFTQRSTIVSFPSPNNYNNINSNEQTATDGSDFEEFMNGSFDEELDELIDNELNTNTNIADFNSMSSSGDSSEQRVHYDESFVHSNQ